VSDTDATTEVLEEILSRELAAKTFYEDLCEEVQGTRFERFLPELEHMAEEEAEHVEEVRELLDKYGE
jgi:rubrerythrin